MKGSQPIFQVVFRQQWAQIPPVMQKHYTNRPYSNDVVTVDGKMDIKFSWLVKLLSPLLRVAE
jgi:hypothetical protein